MGITSYRFKIFKIVFQKIHILPRKFLTGVSHEVRDIYEMSVTFE